MSVVILQVSTMQGCELNATEMKLIVEFIASYV